jgi:hypothetical protein
MTPRRASTPRPQKEMAVADAVQLSSDGRRRQTTRRAQRRPRPPLAQASPGNRIETTFRLLVRSTVAGTLDAASRPAFDHPPGRGPHLLAKNTYFMVLLSSNKYKYFTF